MAPPRRRTAGAPSRNSRPPLHLPALLLASVISDWLCCLYRQPTVAFSGPRGCVVRSVAPSYAPTTLLLRTARFPEVAQTIARPSLPRLKCPHSAQSSSNGLSSRKPFRAVPSDEGSNPSPSALFPGKPHRCAESRLTGGLGRLLPPGHGMAVACVRDRPRDRPNRAPFGDLLSRQARASDVRRWPGRGRQGRQGGRISRAWSYATGGAARPRSAARRNVPVGRAFRPRSGRAGTARQSGRASRP